MKKTFSFETGRTYNSAQILDCEVLKSEQDTIFPDTTWVTIKVVDLSRGMSFVVEVADGHRCNVEAAILRAYDNGNYKES